MHNWERVLTFHLHTRLNPTDRNEMDVLPRGTVIRVKMLNGIDSSVEFAMGASFTARWWIQFRREAR